MRVVVTVFGVHTPDELREAVAQFQARIAARPFMGMLGCPDDNKVKLADVSHLVTKLEIDAGRLAAEITILDTMLGRTLQKLHDFGLITWVVREHLGPAGTTSPFAISGIHAERVESPTSVIDIVGQIKLDRPTS